jgi:hypothetical protein
LFGRETEEVVWRFVFRLEISSYEWNTGSVKTKDIWINLISIFITWSNNESNFINTSNKTVSDVSFVLLNPSSRVSNMRRARSN